MLTVISPAKKLDFEAVDPAIQPSLPDFQADACSLSRTARRLSVAKLRRLMGISEALGKLNQQRFKDFEEAPGLDRTKPAALAFAGDTYVGLEAGSLDAETLEFAQNHLRILSGLYGLLRPMDRIQPYRLEMGSRLATRRGKSLYQYWGGRLAQVLNETASETGGEALVNCASIEYFTAVDRDELKLRVVTPVFMEERDDDRSIVGFFAKQARGAMARFIVENRLQQPGDLRAFDTGGYAYRADLSGDDRLVFTRAYPDPV